MDSQFVLTSTDPDTRFPCVASNPDISGIGVRISIYVQTFLHIFLAIAFCWDGVITNVEHHVLTNTSLNLFLMGVSLLVSTIVQGRASGVISVHHALIVLNLNWNIGLSGLLYDSIWTYNHLLTTTNLSRRYPRLQRFQQDGKPRRTGLVMVVLSCAHLAMTGGVGVWIWSTIETFGDQPVCTELSDLWIFGRRFNVLEGGLKMGSFWVYVVAATPFLNLLCLTFFFLIVVCLLHLLLSFSNFIACAVLGGRPLRSRQRFLLSGSILVVTLLNVLFIVDTELMISRPGLPQLVEPGEGEFTFGQVLAVAALIISLKDVGVGLWRALAVDNWRAYRAAKAAVNGKKLEEVHVLDDLDLDIRGEAFGVDQPRDDEDIRLTRRSVVTQDGGTVVGATPEYKALELSSDSEDDPRPATPRPVDVADGLGLILSPSS